MHSELKWRRYPAAALLGLLAVTASAGDKVAGDEAPDQELTSLELTNLEGLAPLSADKLDESTAKAQIQIDKIQVSENDLNGVVSDNVAIGNTTGNNTVSDGAFTSSTGFMTTIQNTGNNVLIQNATIITVSVEP